MLLMLSLCFCQSWQQCSKPGYGLKSAIKRKLRKKTRSTIKTEFLKCTFSIKVFLAPRADGTMCLQYSLTELCQDLAESILKKTDN